MALGGYTLANNVRSTLAVGANTVVTTLTVDAAVSPNKDFPTPVAGFPGVATLVDSLSVPTKYEIVTYTGVSVNGSDFDLTGVTRGLGGTTAQTWDAGAIIMQAPIADMLTGRLLVALIEDLVGCSLVGRSASSTGVPAAITASSNDTVLRRRSGALGFGSIINADVDAAAAIAISKLGSMSAQSILGRAASSGTPGEFTAAEMQVLLRAAGGNLGFGTLTGQFIRQATLESASTSITLSDATHHGRVLVTTASSAVTITCPSTVSDFFWCAIIQGGSGQISFATSGGALLHNVHGHTKTAAQYAEVGLKVYRTSGGNQFLLQGETST